MLFWEMALDNLLLAYAGASMQPGCVWMGACAFCQNQAPATSRAQDALHKASASISRQKSGIEIYTSYTAYLTDLISAKDSASGTPTVHPLNTARLSNPFADLG